MTPAEFEQLADAVATKVADRLANRPRYLGREDMAADLGISTPTLDRYVKQGRIPAIKLDGRVLFDPLKVNEALNGQLVEN